MSYLNETGQILTEQQQIQMCLNCKRSVKMCRGDCAGLTNSFVHKKTSQEIDALILKFYPHCVFLRDLIDATGLDDETIRRHCKTFGLDTSRFKQNIGKKRKK